MSSRYKHEAKEENMLNAISDAFSEFSTLCEELTETRDALEEKWSTTERFQMISDAVDALEQYVDEPSVPAEIEALLKEITITVGMTILARKSRHGPSRQVRFDNAISQLNAAAEHLTEMLDDNDDKADNEKLSQDVLDEIEAYRDELQEAIDGLDGSVEFPGMYG